MNWQYFIAKRIYKSKDGEKEVSKPAVRIAIAGIAIGLAVMLVSVAIVLGFKHQVRNKVIGLSSDIVLTSLYGQNIYQMEPIRLSGTQLRELAEKRNVTHLQRYSHKAGMIMTKTSFQGMMLKGVGQEYDWTFLRQHLEEGTLPVCSDTVASQSVLVSRALADKLHLSVGDKLDTYYLEENVRTRRLKITGIYQTGIPSFDDFFLITDIYTVNRLNNWEDGQFGGVEVAISDYAKLEDVRFDMQTYLRNQLDGEHFLAQTVEEVYPQIFAWLGVLDTNVWVILVLMIGVSGFTMISGLLIIILERTNMIGVLKALGANNTSLRRLFLTLAVFLIGRGMILGNLIALFFFAVQTYWQPFTLDPSIYYLKAVPIEFGWGWFLLINIVTFVVSVLMLIAPSYLITRIHPANSIRFE